MRSFAPQSSQMVDGGGTHLHTVALAAAGAGDAARARGDLLQFAEHLIHDDRVGESLGRVALRGLLFRRDLQLCERTLDGVLLPNEAAKLGGLGAGEADALAVEEPLRAALRQMLAAAHAAGHADAEFFAVEVDLQLALAAFTLHDRARGGKGEAAALLHNGLSAPRAQVADGAHFFFHIVSSRKKFIFVSIIHRHRKKANPFSLRGVQDGTVA